MCSEAGDRKRKGRRLPFICECGDPDCRVHVPMTAAEYRALPQAPPGLALAPGHRLSGQGRDGRGAGG